MVSCRIPMAQQTSYVSTEHGRFPQFQELGLHGWDLMSNPRAYIHDSEDLIPAEDPSVCLLKQRFPSVFCIRSLFHCKSDSFTLVSSSSAFRRATEVAALPWLPTSQWENSPKAPYILNLRFAKCSLIFSDGSR